MNQVTPVTDSIQAKPILWLGIYDWSIQSGILFSENRCTVEASFLDAELKLLNQTISIICNNPSELHQAGFSFRIIN